MKTLQAIALLLPFASAHAQVNSGSNGSDGALNLTGFGGPPVAIDMSDHPDGIYQYTSVNIGAGVTVTFVPNVNNTPVVWLVQSNCVISGTIDVSGNSGQLGSGGAGGPGGYRGGNPGIAASPGQGPGGGGAGANGGGSASYATLGGADACGATAGAVYGNSFLIPLLGGSGGGGGTNHAGYSGGGGGGAILVAASGRIELNGAIYAWGGSGLSFFGFAYGGGGSGGGVRLIASTISGAGSVNALGGGGGACSGVASSAGSGRVRFDAFANNFGGTITGGVFTQGYQPIIIPTAGQGSQLSIASVGGVNAPASPTGVLVPPDATISGQQANPISVVVHCLNIPLNTPVTVSVKPVNGSPLSAVGYNNAGSLASSVATVLLNIPRGGGHIYATAVLSPQPGGGGRISEF